MSRKSPITIFVARLLIGEHIPEILCDPEGNTGYYTETADFKIIRVLNALRRLQRL